MNKLFFALLVLAFSITSCTPAATNSPDEYRMPTDIATSPELTQTVEVETASRTPPRDCPVTTLSKSTFAAPEPYSPSAPWEGIFWFGSEHLWTALQDDGVWYGLPLNPDGYTQKIMWWSDSYSLSDEPEPALAVTGRRLDGESPPLRFYGATNAMADDIGEAMLTGVEFPSLGCWEVRGEYKKYELKFVVWVAP